MMNKVTLHYRVDYSNPDNPKVIIQRKVHSTNLVCKNEKYSFTEYRKLYKDIKEINNV